MQKKVNLEILKKAIIIAMCVVVLAFAFLKMNGTRNKLEYKDHLKDTVVTLDDNELLFEDLAFYIMYEERVVEEEARIYNPQATKDYWNIHTSDKFIQDEAKDAIINMAIHDELFYRLAVEEGLDELTYQEKYDLKCAISDFWEDLLDVQLEHLPVSYEIINDQLTKVAIAEKYQNYLAAINEAEVASYKYDGYYYSLILQEHDVKINKKLWERFIPGDITLVHTNVNFVNGYDHEKKKEK